MYKYNTTTHFLLSRNVKKHKNMRFNLTVHSNGYGYVFQTLKVTKKRHFEDITPQEKTILKGTFVLKGHKRVI